MRIEWTERAYAQLDEAAAFIARERSEVAAAWVEGVLEAADTLAELPDRGRLVPEIGRPDIRELIVGRYRLVYRRRDDVVSIVMFLHERREFDPEAIP